MLISYQMHNASDDIPYGLHLVRRESEAGHGGANGSIIASVTAGYFAVADEVISGRVADQA